MAIVQNKNIKVNIVINTYKYVQSIYKYNFFITHYKLINNSKQI